MDDTDLAEEIETGEACLQFKEPVLTDKISVLFKKHNLIVKTENEYAQGPLSLWQYDKKSEFSLLGVFNMDAAGNVTYYEIAKEQSAFVKDAVAEIMEPFRQSGGILHSKEMCQIRKASDNVYFDS